MFRCLKAWLFSLSVAGLVWLPTTASAVVTPLPLHQSESAAQVSDLAPAADQAAETEDFLVADSDGQVWLAVYVGKNPYTGEKVFVLSPLGLQAPGGGAMIPRPALPPVRVRVEPMPVPGGMSVPEAQQIARWQIYLINLSGYRNTPSETRLGKTLVNLPRAPPKDY